MNCTVNYECRTSPIHREIWAGWVGGTNAKPESKLMTWTKQLHHFSFWLNNTFVMCVLKKPGQSSRYVKPVQQWNSAHTSWNWHRQQTIWDPTSMHCGRIKSTQNTSQDFHNYVILKTNGKSSITALQKTNLAVKFYTRTHTETDKLKIPPHLTVAESKVHSINTHSPYIHPPPCFTRLSNQQRCFTLIIDTAMRLCPPQVMRVPAGSFTLLPTLICSS